MDQPTHNEPRFELFEAAIACQVEAVRELDAILDDLLATIDTATPTQRGTVLVAGIGRARQTARIIVELSKKHYVEDMAILSRTIAETAINTCYLQVCNEDEFKRFMIFDPIADLKLHRELKNASGHAPSPEAEIALEKMAQAALDSGLFPKKPKSWTDVSLAERARLSDQSIDKRFNDKCLEILRTSVYQHGHTFVHFTRRSLGHFASIYLQSGRFSEPQRLMQVLVMVGAANHALMGIAMFLMSKFKLATHKEWDGLNELLQTMKLGLNDIDLSPP